MPSFRYEVKDAQGRSVSGTLEAATEQVAARQLRAQGYWVIRVSGREVGLQGWRARVADGWSAFWQKVVQPTFLPVSSKALGTYFASFASMTNAGMTILESAEHLSQRTQSRILRRASREIRDAAERGEPISSILPRYPAAFPRFVISMVEAGERSGLLDRIFQQLAGYFERTFRLEQAMRFETLYPKLLIAFLVVWLSIMANINLVLEANYLQLLLFVALTLLRLLPLVLAVWYGWRLLMRVEALRRAVDRIKISLPWVGSLIRRFSVAKWARTFAMLSEAGVPIHQGLITAAEACGNQAMAESLRRQAPAVYRGQSLHEVMQATREFPAMALDLVAVAERAGSIDSALNKVAEYYETETESGSKQAVIATGVGFFIIVALIMAYYIITSWAQSPYITGLQEMLNP